MRWRGRGLLIVACCLLACPPPPTEPPATVTVGAETKTRLRLRVQLGPTLEPPSGSGVLAIGWYRPEELPSLRAGKFAKGKLFAPLIERLRAFPARAFKAPGASQEVEIAHPGGTLVAFALFDHSKMFWSSVFGGDGGNNLLGLSKPIDATTGQATIVLDTRLPSRPRPEPCQGDRFELVHVDAPEVAGAIGNDTDRRLCVYLPAGYAKEPKRRYPVIYLLPGLGGNHMVRLRGPRAKNAAVVADEVAQSGGQPVILVGIDASHNLGSSYFVDSPTSGAWETFFLSLPLVVDGRFRTIAKPTGRALLGKSTGGFNAVSLGLRHSEMFRVIAASAPDGLDLGRWLLVADGSVHPMWLKLMRFEDIVGGSGQMASFAADWSFDLMAKSGFVWPVDLETGGVRKEVLDRWLAHSPSRMLDDDDLLAKAKQHLAGRIYINIGRSDEFHLFEPAKLFVEKLNKLGITHRFEVSEGGHFAASPPLIPAAVRFAIETLGASIESKP